MLGEKKMNMITISIEEETYPEKLKKIYNPPKVLYAMGNINLLSSFSIAMIGCREYTEYGKSMAMYFSYQLAKGIDGFSHIGALRAGGNTIAVVGNGLDIIYPKEHKKLEQEIIQKGGVIVSEYPLGTKPDKYTFPARNRIISALSDGVFVIEAKEKSGTLITVDFALEQGKDIFALPGNITSRNSVGTNQLIGDGAKCVTQVKDILEEYGNFFSKN